MYTALFSSAPCVLLCFSSTHHRYCTVSALHHVCHSGSTLLHWYCYYFQFCTIYACSVLLLHYRYLFLIFFLAAFFSVYTVRQLHVLWYDSYMFSMYGVEVRWCHLLAVFSSLQLSSLQIPWGNWNVLQCDSYTFGMYGMEVRWCHFLLCFPFVSSPWILPEMTHYYNTCFINLSSSSPFHWPHFMFQPPGPLF